MERVYTYTYIHTMIVCKNSTIHIHHSYTSSIPHLIPYDSVENGLNFENQKMENEYNKKALRIYMRNKMNFRFAIEETF